MKKVFAEQSNGATGRQSNRSKQPKMLTPQELEAEGIFMLKQKSSRFPEAIAYCRLCEYHVHLIDQHLKHPDHKKAKTERKRVERLGVLPEPTPLHSAALTILVEEVAKTRGRPVEHLLAISDLAEMLSAALQRVIHPECQVRVYGSCQTGLALQTSNVNFELIYPEEFITHSAALTVALNFLSSSDEYTNVTSNFDTMWPSVTFCSQSLAEVGSPQCVLSVRNSQAYEIGRLLRVYIDFRPQLAVLGQALRHWARVCKLDDGTAGGLPPYAFDLMLVHFLQQSDYLPVLHELMPKSETERQSTDDSAYPYQSDPLIISRAFSGNSDWDLGEIWWRFFKYYTVMRGSQDSIIQIRRKAPVDRDEKNWTKKRIAIEDPFIPMKNLAQFSQAMFEYFANCLQTTFVYFVIPRTRDGALFHFDLGNQLPTPPTANPVVRQKSRLLSDGPRVREINAMESEVAVIQMNDGGRHERSPLTTPSPTGESELMTAPSQTAHDHSCEYTSDFLRQLATTSLPNSSLPHEVMAKCERANILSSSSGSSDDRAQESDFHEAVIYCMTIQSEPSAEQNESENASVTTENEKEKEMNAEEEGEESDEDYEHRGPDVIVLDDDEGTTDEQPSGSVDVSADSPSPVDDRSIDVDVEGLSEKLAGMAIADYSYDFSENCFCGDMIAEVICLYCTVVGHKEANCPEKKLPEITPLPPMTKEFHDATEAMLEFLYDQNKITQYQVQFMEQLRQTLYDKLETNLFAGNCRLDLFGSARNGFGFCHSDIDLCLRFKEDQLPANIDPKVVIQQCADLLSIDHDFQNVIPITAAKVPIVKFKHFWQTVEGDISLYNVLALRNTELLWTYAMMDMRVRKLGIIVKMWAKHCDVGDASKGSLSSYSLIIMLIHYLQRCDPPVVPVLQEMDNEDGEKKVMVEGWNTYFFSDLKVLRSWSRNRQTVSELWLGFLRYYAEQKFNPALDVVQIRQTKTLTKFEKLWTGKSLAIEDPFDLNHNLAAGLGKRMFSYIWRSIIQSRSKFGNPTIHQNFLRQWHAPAVYDDKIDLRADFMLYMLEESRLQEEPPRDRTCRICATVGHFAESCPRNRRNKAAARREQQSQNYNHNHQRYVRERQPWVLIADPSNRPKPVRGYGGHSYIVNSPLNSSSRGNYSPHQSSPLPLEQRRSSTDDKSSSRKERRHLRADARKIGDELRQSDSPSSVGEGSIDDEHMTAALGVAFVNSVAAMSPLEQSQQPRMRAAYNRGSGGGRGGHGPGGYSPHSRPFVQRVPQRAHLHQQHSVQHRLAGAAGSIPLLYPSLSHPPQLYPSPQMVILPSYPPHLAPVTANYGHGSHHHHQSGVRLLSLQPPLHPPQFADSTNKSQTDHPGGMPDE